MMNHSLSHWTIEDGRNGLLLFAQAMEELTSVQSHDSHKVPVFNFHFICYEILTVVQLIKSDVLDKGNLSILLSEMESLFNSDDIAKTILGDSFNSLFILRTVKGGYDENNYENKILKDSESGLSLLEETLHFVISELEIDDRYYNTLVSRIRDAIIASNDMEHLDEIPPLTKMLASELINRSYHQSYMTVWIIFVPCAECCIPNMTSILTKAMTPATILAMTPATIPVMIQETTPGTSRMYRVAVGIVMHRDTSTLTVTASIVKRKTLIGAIPATTPATISATTPVIMIVIQHSKTSI